MQQHAGISVPIPVDADSLWREIGGFGAVAEWHPMLAEVDCEGEAPGARRTARAKDGSRQVERLQKTDPRKHYYRYAIEQSSLPVRNYVAELRVDDNGNGSSTVTWQADFDVPDKHRAETVRMVESFLKAGVESLKKRHAGANGG